MLGWRKHSSAQPLSGAQLCDPTDCSTPGFPVHHQLPEPAQTRVHCVSVAMQPSHPLSSPSQIAGTNINNLRYVDDTSFMAESEEKLKSLWIKVKNESEKASLKLNSPKTKVMAYGPSLHDK